MISYDLLPEYKVTLSDRKGSTVGKIISTSVCLIEKEFSFKVKPKKGKTILFSGNFTSIKYRDNVIFIWNEGFLLTLTPTSI